MTTLNWTRINFGILELLNLIERIELQNDIIFNRLANIIKFPRVALNQHGNDLRLELPSNDNILATIKNALEAAIETTSKFGMVYDPLNVVKCQSKMPRTLRHQNLTNDFSDEEGAHSECSDEDESSLENRTEHLHLRNYNDVAGSEILQENSKFIEVYEPDGTSKIVLKSSIVWVLTNSTERLSSDRLKRVEGSHPHKLYNAKRSRLSPRLNSSLSVNNGLLEHDFFKSDKIYIGDWCVFGLDSERNPNVCMPAENAIENMLVGCVISFKYIIGSTEKEKQYHLKFANVLDDNQIAQRDDLQIFSAWYTFDENGIFISLGNNRSFFVNMEKYIATTFAPIIKQNLNDKNVLSFIGDIAHIKKSIMDLVK